MAVYSHDDYTQATEKSIHNRAIIKQSDMVGCYYCLQIYKASSIKEFIDENADEETTALCPLCGIDSVLGDADGLPDEDHRELFLKYIRWYGFCHLHCRDGSIKITEEMP